MGERVTWICGRTHTGKTTLAKRLATEWTMLLDGDEMQDVVVDQDGREKLTPTRQDTDKHELRVARIAKWLSDKGFPVIVSVIAPYAETREKITALCNPFWVYVTRTEGLPKDDRPYEVPECFTIDNDRFSEQEAESLTRKAYANFIQQ